MFKTKNNTATIHCDKCHKESKADIDKYNDAFFNEGWLINPRARKYFAICRDCQTVKQRKMHDKLKFILDRIY